MPSLISRDIIEKKPLAFTRRPNSDSFVGFFNFAGDGQIPQAIVYAV